MNYTYELVTEPAAKPLTLTQVKEHLRIDVTDTTDDDYLNVLIDVATDYAEKYTKRDFITRTWRTYRDCFPYVNNYNCSGYDSVFVLRKAPVQSITSVEYLDSDNNTQAFDSSNYYIPKTNRFTQIVLDKNKSWPSDISDRKQSVIITFVSGYGDADTDVPDSLKQAMLLMIANLYTNRGDCSLDNCNACLDAGGKRLLNQYKIIDISYRSCGA